MKNTLMKYKYIILILLLLILPFPLSRINDYFLHIVIVVAVYSILALSLNVIVGYAGQFALGHAAFYGIGAYTAAILMTRSGFSFWSAIACAAVMTGLCGFLLGLPVIRLKGDYLGIVTLAFGEIVRLFFVNWVPLTNGPMGIPGIPHPTIFGFEFTTRINFYYIILALLSITAFIIYRIVYSGFGLNLLTIRKDESLAESIGIRPVKYKLMAFSIGAFFAGIAGAFWAAYISYISPDAFKYMDSINILSMVVLGGTASIPGSFLGAFIMVLTPEILRYVNDYRMMVLGIVIVCMMIFKPSGFIGEKYRQFNFFGMKGVHLVGKNNETGKGRS